MRKPVSVKSFFPFFPFFPFFFFLPCEFLSFEPSRLCRLPSIRTLLLSDFRSVPVGRPRFSRCCYLIIDLGSPLFKGSWARSSAQSPELGGQARLFGCKSWALL